MKTVSTRAQDVVHDWYIVDASQYTLGRLAAALAHRLRGKHKPQFTPHVDSGDYIIVVNAEQVRVTGRKDTDKVYYRHTGYPGGIKSRTLQEMREKQPEQIIQRAVKGMLPRNPLGRQVARKLKVYRGSEHPHSAQQPRVLTL
ncbi:MAG: 50S ribosomal protein L13 [Gammaproteobacteria bacterium]|nr:50S ribosomal protein L13 [Gammaproteobacteria bacterium]MYF38807.1 50S ribosomal protein L13 [Gammaproteobacteria bacterium]